MHSLNTGTAACNKAIKEEDHGVEWQYTYSDMVDSRSVLKFVTLAGGLESLPSSNGLHALAKMIRELSGPLRYAAADKRDPVRDDLVEGANQLLRLVEI